MPIHPIAFVSGCLVGAYVAALLRQREVDRLVRITAELRAEVLGHIFRPVTPEETEAVLAEWLSQYDPNWSGHDR